MLSLEKLLKLQDKASIEKMDAFQALPGQEVYLINCGSQSQQRLIGRKISNKLISNNSLKELQPINSIISFNVNSSKHSKQTPFFRMQSS